MNIFPKVCNYMQKYATIVGTKITGQWILLFDLVIVYLMNKPKKLKKFNKSFYKKNYHDDHWYHALIFPA